MHALLWGEGAVPAASLVLCHRQRHQLLLACSANTAAVQPSQSCYSYCTAVSSKKCDEPDVRNARDLPKEVLALQATSPSTFAVTALAGHHFAWIKPAGAIGPEQLLAADPQIVQSWFKDEWELGSVTGWPDTISECRCYRTRYRARRLSSTSLLW
jgi:hypothetical protein